MKIRLLTWPYRVHSSVAGWRGWRLGVRYLGIREECDCTSLRAEHGDWADDCPCLNREPHTHTGLMSYDRPLFFPKATT